MCSAASSVPDDRSKANSTVFSQPGGVFLPQCQVLNPLFCGGAEPNPPGRSRLLKEMSRQREYVRFSFAKRGDLDNIMGEDFKKRLRKSSFEHLGAKVLAGRCDKSDFRAGTAIINFDELCQLENQFLGDAIQALNPP